MFVHFYTLRYLWEVSWWDCDVHVSVRRIRKVYQWKKWSRWVPLQGRNYTSALLTLHSVCKLNLNVLYFCLSCGAFQWSWWTDTVHFFISLNGEWHFSLVFLFFFHKQDRSVMWFVLDLQRLIVWNNVFRPQLQATKSAFLYWF